MYRVQLYMAKIPYVIFIFADVHAKKIIHNWLAQALKIFWVRLCMHYMTYSSLS
jgi:hypothetical protein